MSIPATEMQAALAPQMSAEDAANQKEAASRAAAEQEAALVKEWCKRIDHCRKHDEKQRKQWADDRKMAAGTTEWAVNTNLIGAIMEILAAFLYAKNPTPQVRPSASVNRSRMDNYQAVAETAEIICTAMWKMAGLKRKAKRWVRAGMTVGIGWLRASMQTRTEIDPTVQNEINDLKQQLLRYEALIAQSEDGCEAAVTSKAQAELQMVALNGKRERRVATGLRLDVMAAEDVLVSTECNEIEGYLDADWIAFDIYKTCTEAMSITGWDAEGLKHCTRYQQRPRDGNNEDAGCYVVSANGGADQAESMEGFLRFTEIWSKRDGVVLTKVEGCKDKWARPAFAPLQSQRFYDVFGLSFHAVDQLRYPQSDVQQLSQLQDEYGSVRSNKRLHRKRAIPGMVFDSGQIGPEDAAKLQASDIQEWVGVKLSDPGKDMRTAFAPKAYAQVDGALYDTSDITRDMEKVSGAQDAMQGAVAVEKTATEARIEDSGFGARTGARRDTLEEVLGELAEHTVQLSFQAVDPETALRFAGEDRAWLQLSAEEAHMLYDIDVKAGTTGRPKASQDRETWGTLMPLIQGIQDKVGQLRAAGPQNEWLVKPLIALLGETMKRLDDPAPLLSLIPTPPPPNPITALLGGQPGAPSIAPAAPAAAQPSNPAATPIPSQPQPPP